MFTGTDGEHAAACFRHATRSHSLPQLGRGRGGGASLQLPSVQLQVVGQGPRVFGRSRHIAQSEQPEQILRESFQGQKEGDKYWTSSTAAVNRKYVDFLALLPLLHPKMPVLLGARVTKSIAPLGPPLWIFLQHAI